jgi:hypothetical protein
MEPLSGAVAGVLGEMLRKAPNSPGKITFAWKAVVGPAVDRVTRVHLHETTLIVETVTPEWRRELARSTPAILRKLRKLLGDQTIQDIIIRE